MKISRYYLLLLIILFIILLTDFSCFKTLIPPKSQIMSSESNLATTSAISSVMIENSDIVLTTNPIDPPWLNIKVYTDPIQTIKVKIGEQFIITYDEHGDRYPIIQEIHDSNYLLLVGRKGTTYQTYDAIDNMMVWFLFKSLKSGDTQIFVNHRLHLSGSLVDHKMFNVNIE